MKFEVGYSVKDAKRKDATISGGLLLRNAIFYAFIPQVYTNSLKKSRSVIIKY